MNTKSNFKAIKVALLNAVLMLNLSAEMLVNFKQEALKLGQPACFFTTVGDPCLRVVDPGTDIATIIECGCHDADLGKNRHVKKPEDLVNLKVLWLMENLYGADCQTNKKYRGEEESAIGQLLEKVFVPEEEYPGTILVDEYKKGIPMFWVLQNAQEFKAISTYILKKFAEQEFAPTQKVLLVLKIENDPKLETLNETDQAFLNSYFELFPTTDKEVKEFFEGRKEDLLDSFKYLSADPKMINETATQGIFRKMDGFWKEFNGNRVAIIAGAFITTGLLHKEIMAAHDAITKKITGGKSTFAEWLIG